MSPTFILKQCMSGWVLHNSFLYLLLKSCDSLYTNISQGSVATHLGCGGVFKENFVTNFLLSLTVKKLWKSVNIWWSYGQEFGVLFFWLTVYLRRSWAYDINKLTRYSAEIKKSNQGRITPRSPHGASRSMMIYCKQTCQKLSLSSAYLI